tara:strand:+ start:326 stop:583 length:258 start_codon:yes stop_codon:yes gene_type:complete
MGYLNTQGGVSPLKQKVQKYWFKINGKPCTQKQYCAYKNDPGGDKPGKTTNHPDPCGIRAKHKASREKLRKPTVLTEQQTKNLKK